MLREITIRNVAVIRETRIDLGETMTAITGETGAGKSIVLDALGAVLGERTSADIVRSGEERAYVEAIFDLPPDGNRAAILRILDDNGVEYDSGEPLILSRDIVAEGRSTARINGRAVTAGTLTQIGELLVDIHGQSEHLSLLRAASQRNLLDRFAGAVPLRREFRDLYREWRTLKRRIESFEVERRERAQRLDLLRFQREEIESIEPREGEDEELQAELNILTNAEKILTSATDAHNSLAGADLLDPGSTGALDQIRNAEAHLGDISRFDPQLEDYLNQLREALFTLEELDSSLRDYRENLEFDPDKLETSNQRLNQLRELTRKYGRTITEVLEYRGEIATEIDELETQDQDIDALRQEERDLRSRLTTTASKLRQLRKDSATELSSLVEQTITELNMGNARFEVRFDATPDPSGVEVDGEVVAIDESGADQITFLLAANPGSEPRPLARVASGGEMARLMLALKSILSDVDATPTLVFDEIDVGVGGRSGQLVGEKLWNLTDHHQVIVISHLPQVAAFAESHTAMIKGEAETTAVQLVGDDSIDEIATMFDGLPVTPESRANAVALIGRVRAWKEERRRAGVAATSTLL